MIVIKKRTLDYINAQPALVSFLYDIDLLPEQVTTREQRSLLVIVSAAFEAGRKSK